MSFQKLLKGYFKFVVSIIVFENLNIKYNEEPRCTVLYKYTLVYKFTENFLTASYIHVHAIWYISISNRELLYL